MEQGSRFRIGYTELFRQYASSSLPGCIHIGGPFKSEEKTIFAPTHEMAREIIPKFKDERARGGMDLADATEWHMVYSCMLSLSHSQYFCYHEDTRWQV